MRIKNNLVFFFIFLMIFLPLKAKVLEIRIDTPIHSVTEEYLVNGIKHANSSSNDYPLIIVKLDTPGGLDLSMRGIIKSILNSNIPVAVFVYPSGARAASAGFFILMSADIAVMSKGTNTGAAHPVSISGQKTDKTMEDKILNDASAYIKNLAEKRGRNINLAEKAVRESKSYTDSEALKNNLIDFVAENSRNLLEKVDGERIKRFNGSFTTIEINDFSIEGYEMSWRQKFLHVLANPSLAYILLMLGFLGLYFEFSHPGGVLPGIIGAIFLLLAAMAFQILPVNYTGLFLIIFSVILFIAEIKVQGFGILGISGIISLILGSIILIDSPVKELRMPLSFVLPVSIFISAIFVIILILVVKAHREKIQTGDKGIIGEKGKAATDIDKYGKIFVHGEWWNAHSDEPIKKGERIIIVGKQDGMILNVKKYKSDN